VGNSRVEAEKLQLAKNILQMAEKQGIKIVLPIDHLVIDNLDNPTLKKITEASAIPLGFLGVDIGPQTIAFFKKELQGAKTVLWNGPLGIFEKNDYAKGTKEIAQALTVLKNATVIVGGGDSASAAKKFGVADKLAHVSTGGGASLEFLEGKELPGIAIIPDKK
jgi:phosphoglycerate kinase